MPVTTIKIAVEVDIDIRPDVIEAIRAQYAHYTGEDRKHVDALNDLGLVKYYLAHNIRWMLEEDEGDLMNIAEVDEAFIERIDTN